MSFGSGSFWISPALVQSTHYVCVRPSCLSHPPGGIPCGATLLFFRFFLDLPLCSFHPPCGRKKPLCRRVLCFAAPWANPIFLQLRHRWAIPCSATSPRCRCLVTMFFRAERTWADTLKRKRSLGTLSAKVI